MNAKWLPISAAVIMALGSASASAVDFHGYARAGMNLNTDGGNTYCPGTGGSGHAVGRLGAECDTYAELQLGQEVYNKGGNKFNVVTMLAYGTTEGNADLQGNNWQGETGTGPWGGQRSSLRQAYGDYTMSNGATVWAGKKYYQRKDIHIMDLYYLNNSGYGGGIENVQAGPGQFSAAVLKTSQGGNGAWGSNDPLDDWRDAYKVDLRYSGLTVNTDGSMEFAVVGGFANLSDEQKDSGMADDSGMILHAEHTQGNFFGGFNKLIAQYATNGFATDPLGNHLGDNYAPNPDGDMWRVMDWGVTEGDTWALGYAAIYGQLSNTDKGGWLWTDTDQYSLVVRPEYKWNNFMKTSLELGYSATKRDAVDNGDWKDLSKVTLAQSFNAGSGFWARPSIRVYGSYINGDQVKSSSYGVAHDTDSEFLLGTQVEAWW
jgi:maltoporin